MVNNLTVLYIYIPDLDLKQKNLFQEVKNKKFKNPYDL